MRIIRMLTTEQKNAPGFIDPRTKREIKHFCCVDCGKDTFLDNKDYYMVTNEVWKKHGVGKNMLCVDCMEARLGHKLRKDEITLCQQNLYHNKYTRRIIYHGNKNI